jgi:hypothetical protein
VVVHFPQRSQLEAICCCKRCVDKEIDYIEELYGNVGNRILIEDYLPELVPEHELFEKLAA